MDGDGRARSAKYYSAFIVECLPSLSAKEKVYAHVTFITAIEVE
jgi:hypothetical protein